MDYTFLRSTFRGLKKESSISRMTIFIEGAAIFLLAVVILTRDRVTTIIPWTMQHSGYVSEDMASESYKTAWGMALAMLLGNCNYGSVDTIEKRIAPLLPNDIYQSTMTALRAQAMQFKENRITVRFEITKYIYEPATDKVFVEGDYYIKAPGLAEKKEKRSYEFIIGMESYMPQILYMDTYADVARTQQRLKQLEDQKRSVKHD